MSRKTYAALSAQAQQIKIETVSKANSANRVGTMMQDLIDTLFNNGSFVPNWDMSTDAFPSGSLRGDKWYGVNGPTTLLLDRQGNRIPTGVMLESLEDNAATNDPTKWALSNTII